MVRLAYTFPCFFFFFFNDTAPTEIYTLSLHDALPISRGRTSGGHPSHEVPGVPPSGDRKSTRLNSSHGSISYAVFCLQKKKKPVHRVLLRVQHQDEHCRISV